MPDPSPQREPPPLLQYRSGIDERKAKRRVPAAVQVPLATLGTMLGLWTAQAGILALTESRIASVLMLLAFSWAFCVTAGNHRKEDSRKVWPIGVWYGCAFAVLGEALMAILSMG
jgi:hypothetical protein